MKLICNQKDLITALNLVSKAVPFRPTHPILGNVLLESDYYNQTLSLTGFDLSLGIRSVFHCTVQEQGKITIPAKLLTDIVSKLDQDEITLFFDETNENSTSVLLTAPTGKYEVQAITAEDYPELPTIAESQTVNIPVKALKEGLNTVFSASQDETKQVLTGVHIDSTGDRIEFATTDGHRLSVISPEIEEGDVSEFKLTIPARTLREVEKIISSKDDDDSLTFSFESNQLLIDANEQKLFSRILEGNYPNYHQLIPKQFNRQMTVERKRVIAGVERVAVLADQKNNIVRFTINGDEQIVTLSVETREVGSGKETLNAQFSGDNIEIAFNIKYLLEGLKAMTTNEVTFQLNDPNRPVIITPVGGIKMTYLIMPVQIRE